MNDNQDREIPTSMRLPAHLLDHADKLAGVVGSHPSFSNRASSRVSRSAVLRVALERGLNALEQDLSKERA